MLFSGFNGSRVVPIIFFVVLILCTCAKCGLLLLRPQFLTPTRQLVFSLNRLAFFFLRRKSTEINSVFPVFPVLLKRRRKFVGNLCATFYIILPKKFTLKKFPFINAEKTITLNIIFFSLFGAKCHRFFVCSCKWQLLFSSSQFTHRLHLIFL